MDVSQIISSSCPVLLSGAPGIGKTAVVVAAADYVEVMLASAMTEEDILGLPYREGATEHRTMPAAIENIINHAKNGESTVLFLDELDKARRSVADTLLTLVASRRVGQVQLPSTTAIVAAANPLSRSGGDGISEAMRSRFAIVPFEPSVKDWCQWARTQFSSPWALNIIVAVERGEMPLIEEILADDELDSRTTCPRTWALTLGAIDRTDMHTALTLANGLLTVSVASRLKYYSVAPEGSEAALQFNKHARRRAAAAALQKEPMRL